MAYGVQPKVTGSGIAGQGRPYAAKMWDGYDPTTIDRMGQGWYFQDDFNESAPVFAANSAAATRDLMGRYHGMTDATAGTTILPIAGQGGVIELASTTDNEVAGLQFGYTTERPLMLTTGIEDDTWPYHHLSRIRCETRFSLNATAITDEQSIFIGLAGVMALTDMDTDTGELVDSKNFFGFRTLNAAPQTLQFVYQAAADTTVQTLIADVGTLALDTWYTVGFDYNPASSNKSERGTFFFNGTHSNTYLTKAQSVAATFPLSDDSTQVDLAPTWMRGSGDGTTSGLRLSGWRVWEEYLVAPGNEANG